MSVQAMPLEQVEDSENCRKLWAKVLRQAVIEWMMLSKEGYFEEQRERLRAELRSFFFRDGETFEFICDTLDLNIVAVRERLMEIGDRND